MDGSKPPAKASGFGFVTNHSAGPANTRTAGDAPARATATTTTTITSTTAPPSPPDKEPGCGIKRALSRRCRKGLSCFVNMSAVKGAGDDIIAISQPTNVAHVTHVGFDERTGEYIGLPKEWKQLLSQGPRTAPTPAAALALAPANDNHIDPAQKRRSRRYSREL